MRGIPLLGRLRHRGAILLILSLIDFAYGLSLISPAAESLGSAAVRWRELYAPLWAWGIAWVVVGAVLVFYAFRTHDAVGFTAAIGLKVVWGLTTLASWVLGDVQRGWVATIIWLVFAGMIAVIADWPEPSRSEPAEEVPSSPGDPTPPQGIIVTPLDKDRP